jgi:hypothetical protein
MTHNCTYCKKQLSSLSSLNHHLATAKYCIKIRNNNSVKQKKLSCRGCKRNFTLNQSLNRHELKCVKVIIIDSEEKYKEHYREKYENEITQLKEQLVLKDTHIKELESKLENIALKAVSRPTTVNNQNDNRVQTVINNLLPITDKHLQEQAKFLTLDHIKQGSIGYSQYAMDYPLKDRIACTDFARRKVKYKNEDGQVITDPEMTVLLKKLFSAIQSENRNMCHEYSQKLQDLIMNETKNASDDMDEKQAEILTTKNEEIMDIIFEICSQARQVNEISQGKKPELFYEIIRDICTRSIVN